MTEEKEILINDKKYTLKAEFNIRKFESLKMIIGHEIRIDLTLLYNNFIICCDFYSINNNEFNKEKFLELLNEFYERCCKKIKSNELEEKAIKDFSEAFQEWNINERTK